MLKSQCSSPAQPCPTSPCSRWPWSPAGGLCIPLTSSSAWGPADVTAVWVADPASSACSVSHACALISLDKTPAFRKRESNSRVKGACLVNSGKGSSQQWEPETFCFILGMERVHVETLKIRLELGVGVHASYPTYWGG